MGYFSSRGFLFQFLIFVGVFAAPTCWAFTDPRDVYAINSLYAALGSPKFLGWTGGDPCGLGWEGVQCVNANVTGIVLSGSNLGGRLTEDLGYLSSIIQIDLNDNHIGGPIPSNLPLTIRSLFLSNNKFTGSIPDTISSLGQLSELYLDNNLITGAIPDAFQQLKGLVTVDFSGNKLGGQLPSSMGNLTSLTKLHLQNNQLTGTLDVLGDLPLADLNIENNLFSGPIPEKLVTIPKFRKNGNPFNTSVLPSPPVSSPSPPPLPPPIPIISSSPKPAPQSRQAAAPPMVLASDTGKKKAVKSSRIILWLAIGLVATIALNFAIYIFLSRCCNKKPVPSELKSHGKNNHGSAHANPKPNDYTQKPIVLEEDDKIDRERMDSGILPPPPPPFPHLSCESTIPDPILALLNSEHSEESVDFPRSFTVASLEQYTNNFSQENLIGRGLLGAVYRAELPDGTVVAVKKLHPGISRRQSDEAFLNLVDMLSKLQHANVVEFVGHCSGQSKRLLVYEYCNNGTLHKALYVDNEMQAKLTWNTRIRLALEAARALEYLHETSQPPIVHQNFKTAKILLDEDLTVHVSDCGLAPLLPSLSMERLQLDGYGAPELEPGRYTSQSDVYSFGVMMLELLTGRKPHDESRPEEEQFLVRWAIPQLHDIDALARMVDPSLGGAYPSKSLSRFADIIFSCIQPEPEFRPPASQVVQYLQQMVEQER